MPRTGNDAKVLILSAYHKHEQFLNDFEWGLVEQTYPHENIELFLVCDSNEGDEQNSVIDCMHRIKDSGISISYALHAENEGAYATFKQLYRHAESSNADYVMILEADDHLYPDFLTKTVFRLEHHAERIRCAPLFNLDEDCTPVWGVHTDVCFRDQSGVILEKAHWKQNGRYDNFGVHTMHMPSGNIREELIKNNFIMTCAFLCTRHAFLKYNDLEYFESLALPMSDYPFVLSMSKDCYIDYIDEPLSNYTVSPGGASNNPEKRAAFVEATLRLQQYARQGII